MRVHAQQRRPASEGDSALPRSCFLASRPPDMPLAVHKRPTCFLC